MATIDELLMSFLGRLERGEAEDEALAALARQHPEQAEALRRRARLLDGLGVLHEAEPSSESAPEQLGPFRLLRRLGEGGMGVVYLAEQAELGRKVALKVLRPEHLFFPGARERFQREVEIVASLSHPSIVPIHTVGDDGGVPYFAMEYLDGITLEAALVRQRERTLPVGALSGRDLASALVDGSADQDLGWLFAGTWEEACLRVMRQVADALEHAHRRGVLHRDLKPGNIMITRGVGGRQVKLLDFGLASAVGDATLTRSGTRLGSLAYMPPEQALGRLAELGPRSDVYSLGVVLYELLTLRRPFEGASEVELIRAIQQGHARPVRELAPTISWESETLCMTAMERDPERRYASAADFARDLGNVLERRPIEARRASWLLRLRRTAQRHPTASVAAALGFVLVVGGPSFFLWRERRAATEVRAHLQRARTSLAAALEAIDRTLVRVASEDLAYMPQMEPVRQALLEDAVELTESLVDSDDSGPEAREATARAHLRLGEVFVALGRVEEALAAFTRSQAHLQALVSAHPNELELRAAYARSLVRVGGTLRDAGRYDEAEREMILALELYETGFEVDGAPDVHLDHARAWFGLAMLRSDQELRESGEQRTDVDELFERALALCQTAIERDPAALEVHLRAADFLFQQSTVLLAAPPFYGPRTRELELLKRSSAHLERARSLAPDDPEIEFDWIRTRVNLAGVHRRQREPEIARALVLEVLDSLRTLVDRFPSTARYQLQLATAYNQLGNTAEQVSMEEAADWYARSGAELEQLVRRAPEAHVFCFRLATSRSNLGLVLRELGQADRALECFRDAVAYTTRAVQLYPENRTFREALAADARHLWRCALRSGERDAVVSAAEGLAFALPDDPAVRADAALATADALRILATSSGEDDRELKGVYLERCIEHLRAASEGGFPGLRALCNDKRLEPLWGLEAFEEIRSGS